MSSFEKRAPEELKPGQQLSGYRVTRSIALETVSCWMVELEHDATGARHIHISAPDAENAFGVMLKTVPQDATGVAHILEHTALCGSRQYPVRDPFFSMLKRSLATFMNAFTGSDWTLYPFATPNRKDFYNLLAVYLDAVFHPRLDRLSFQQEGHRLAFSELGKDQGTPVESLVRQGVVYNEMKGAMSSPDQVAVRSLLNALYPASTYRFNSGGDPSRIPNLTHEQLVAFHRRHYHPSNAFFYTYGDLPLEDHLAYIHQRYLGHFERIDPQTEVAPQPRWSAPTRAVYRYPLGSGEDPGRKHQVTLAWLTADITDAYSVLVLSLIEQMLLGNPGSPLRKALIESGLGSSLSDGTGYSADYRDTLFAAGLKDVEKATEDRIEALVLDTLADLSGRGIDPETVESAIHQIEFSRKEKTNHPYPYGLKLLLAIAGTWLHGGDPARIIELDRDLDRIRKENARGGFFEEQIRRWLVDNNHRVRFLLEPDRQLAEKRAVDEAEDLDRLLRQLDDEQKRRIRSDTEALEALQYSTEDLSVLPTLSLKDIPEKTRTEPETAFPEARGATVYERPTGGVVYLATAAGVGSLQPERLRLVPFFCYALPKTGSRKRDYVQMSRRIDLYTGGVSVSANARTRYEPEGRSFPFVAVNAKCLARNVEPMFDIFREMVLEPDFSDPDRLRTLLAEYRAGLESAVVRNGHRLAISLAARSLSATSALSEIWAGVHQLQFIKSLTSDLSDDAVSKIADSLTAMSRDLFSEGGLNAAVIGEDPALSTAVSAASSFAAETNRSTGGEGEPPDVETAAPREGWATSTAVSFVAAAFATVRMHHEDAAALSLLARIFRSLYLHREIREKGGAYGGLSHYNAEDGVFYLASYRDPHIARTLAVYDRIVDFIDSGAYTDSDVNEAKLQVCAEIDRPDPPGPAARKAFYRKLLGLTDEQRGRFKQQVIAASREQVAAVARRTVGASIRKSPVAVISSETLLREANRELAPELLAIRSI